MNRLTTLGVTTAVLLCIVIGLPPVDAVAQEKQRVSFKISAENTKYTQQHSIEVGDVFGHHVRVYEIQRTFPDNAPVINGVALKEQWTRAISDYTDNNGPGTTYGTYVLENGDKFLVAQLLSRKTPGRESSPLPLLTTSPVARESSLGCRGSYEQ